MASRALLVMVILPGLTPAGCSSGSGDPCSGVECSSRGFCVADQGQAYCACIAGYHPVSLACVANDAADPCRGADCAGHGTCRVEAGEPTCDCAPGYRHLLEGDPRCTDSECDLVCVPVGASDGGDTGDGDADAGPCVPEGERCDRRDNDCDGLTDEDYDLDFDAENCGACGRVCGDAAHGTGTCVLGDCEMICEPGWSDLDGNPANGCEAVCTPGPATAENVCDGRDDDCDGTTNEEWLTADTCGFGLCRRSSICHDGGVVCRPRMPPAATDATCDGLDDDCDGTVDEDCSTGADGDADADADDGGADADADGEADGEVPSFCGNGVVEPGEECDDGNEVSGDGCEPATCVFSCHDDEECRETPVDNPCTTDTCDEVAGGRLCGQVPNPGASCDDGLFCTGTDTCDASGTCISSGDPCPETCRTCNETTDTCDVTSGCWIGGTCYANGASRPGFPCQFCNSTSSRTSWSNRPAATSCDDGVFCNGRDTCNASGTCVSSGDPCSPGTETCNESLDRCDPVCLLGASTGGGIVFLNSGGVCYVAMTTDQSLNIGWGCAPSIDVAGATGTAVGTGETNTNAIYDTCPTTTTTAGYLCHELVSGGFTDWFLPSHDELYYMCLQRAVLAFSSTNSGYYWTSSQIAAPSYTSVWQMHLDDTTCPAITDFNSKMKNLGSLNVRCIRSF